MSTPDFQFTFDASLFPSPPPLPSSADLFSQSEQSDLYGFLDTFGSYNWDDNAPDNSPMDSYGALPPYSNPHLGTLPESTASRTRRSSRPVSSRTVHQQRNSSSPDDTSSRNGVQRPLLSNPQKRLNHIMSEQKRRNAIRDGYAQLISLLAPAHGQALNMPTRGRPKGSGSRGGGKSQTKGKSGVLFRAVEYCKWLEEGRDALREEVRRLEAAAGILHDN